MKKIIFYNFIYIGLISLSFLACDKIPDGIVESQNVDYRILAINAPTSVTYLATDSTVVASIQLSQVNSVNLAWCKVTSLDGYLTIKNQVMLNDDGNSILHGDQQRSDGIYSGKFVMGKMNPNGKYQIEFFVEDNIRQSPENLTKVGTYIFTFDNLQINYAPEISNLIIPTSVNRGEPFIFSVKAIDPNGPADITQVYFKLTRPDGSKVMNGTADFFLMMDNGNLNVFGDQIAGDGIYSFKNSFLNDSSTQTGVWKFEFGATDHAGKTSNILIQNLTVN